LVLIKHSAESATAEWPAEWPARYGLCVSARRLRQTFCVRFVSLLPLILQSLADLAILLHVCQEGYGRNKQEKSEQKREKTEEAIPASPF